MAKPGASRSSSTDKLAPARVLATALAMAEATGWYDLPMRDLARKLGVGLDALARRYRDPDTIADLAFVQARDAMLAPQPAVFARLAARERVERTMLRWFDRLAPHRKVAAAMLLAKLHPSHVHHWSRLPFHLSRLIWWVREGALLDVRGARRQVEEIALSGIFLAVLACWATDSSPEQERTRALLRRLLEIGSGLFR